MAGPIFCPDPNLYPDPTGRADRMCRFVRRLTLWEGRFAGRPFTVHPFQEAIIRRIYGPSTDDGRRLVRTACLWIPRGNAKTALGAALALGHLLGPEAEAGGQIICAAADRENATIAFNHAYQMIRQDRELTKRIRPQESVKKLTHEKTASTLKAISSEAYSKQGLSCSYFLADEIHQWQPAEARPLFGAIRDSMVKREQPLTCVISTAGDGQGTLAHDLWLYSHRVATGEIDDPSFAPIIFAADPKANWDDESVWRAANPAIDAGFCSMDELRIKARRCGHVPREKADFKRYHLNLWADGAAEPWVDPDTYAAADPRRPEEALEGMPAFIGIDMASVTDMAAVAICWPDGLGGYDVDVTGFFPADSLQARGEKDKADYEKWADQGHLKLTSGNVIDQDAILEHVTSLAELYSVQEIVLDRWGATGFITRLQERSLNCVTFGQGFASMSAPCKEMERAILSKTLRHGNNPVLKSAIAHVALEKDAAANVKFTKSKSRGRIDAAVACVMAFARASAGNEASPYTEERGFSFI